MPKFNFGGGNKCETCNKTVYKEEELVFEGKFYHNNGCFRCSICGETIGNVSKAGSMDGKVSHRLCFEKQMRESGGKYGGVKVVVGAKSAADAAKLAPAPAAAATPAAAPAAATPVPAAAAPAAEEELDAATVAFYAKKKAQKQARIMAEELWNDIIVAAQRSGDFDADKLQDMWEEFDADRSGTIDVGELEKLISAISTAVGVSVAVPELVKATITCMDRDGDGELTWIEFVQLSVVQKMGDAKKMAKAASDAVLLEDAVDANAAFYAKKKQEKAARIHAEKLWGAIIDAISKKDDFSGEQLQDMWDEYDTDRSGTLDADELEKLIAVLVSAAAGDASTVPELTKATVVCMDRDGDGELTWAEFVCLGVVQKMGEAKKMRELAEQAAFIAEAEAENARFYARKKGIID